MYIKNIKIVTLNKVIENGFLFIEEGIIKKIGDHPYDLEYDAVDGKGSIAFPGFIDCRTDKIHFADLPDEEPPETGQDTETEPEPEAENPALPDKSEPDAEIPALHQKPKPSKKNKKK